VAPERAVPAPSVGELRAYLKSHLPEFMIPSVFIFLDELPRTGHGKVDRRMLPAPEGVRSVSEENYVAPLTKAEQTIATLWQEALGLEKVGTQDNFFDLGGHSLLLIKVHNRLQQKFNRKFPILEMFRHTTVGQLAAYLSAEEEQTNQPSLQESQDRGRQQKEAIRRRQQLRRLDQVTR
jgi:acyl carrier protein